MEKGSLTILSLVLLALFLVVGFMLTDLGPFPIIIVSIVIVALNALYVLLFFRQKRMRMQFLQKDIEAKDSVLKRKEKAEERLFHDMPTGVVLLDDDLRVRFANRAARDIFKSPLEARPLEILHGEIHEALQMDTLDHPRVFRIYDDYFEVHYHDQERGLYFYKETERERLKEDHENLTSAIGVLHLDNLEDAVGVLDVQEQGEIQGRLLGALDDWAEERGFHIVPVSAAKMYVYLHKMNLEELIDEDFAIIDEIARISGENELIITLSGGFACASIPLSDLARIAEDALDLALSRGGDQIVINIQGEDFKYFGGNTNTQEKRTRISSRINAKKIDMLFTSASKVFIMPHRYADADALGAAIGLLKMALSAHKEAHIVIDDEAADQTVAKIMTRMEYEYVSLLDYFLTPEKALQYFDRRSLLVLADHHSESQLLDARLVEKTNGIIIVDHHRRMKDSIEGVRLAYIEPYASSSTELVAEMVSVYPKNVHLNAFEATVMLLGMVVDTNNFTYRTGSRTFEAAAFLRRYGADTYRVKNILRESLQEKKMKAELIKNAEVVNKRFAITIVPEDFNADRQLLAQVANSLLEVDAIVAAFALGQIGKQTIGISARSLEGFNVQTIMESFGGGGHFNNAGAQIEKRDEADVKKELIELLEDSSQEERPLKVILKKDLKNKGKKGEVLDVKPGYGNYLLTSGQAIEATPENIQNLEEKKKKEQEQSEKHLEEMKALKDRIDYRAVKVYVKIGKNGKLFGKITTKQIAEAFEEQHGVALDKRKIVLDEPIDTLGNYQIDVKLHKDVTATFELMVLEQQDG